jgi:hypothetical protein
LLVTYGAAVRAADDAADALHRGAERMAKAVADRGELARRVAKARGVAAAMETLAGRAACLEREWGDLWRPTGVEPRSPREMLEWRRRWELAAESGRRGEEAATRQDAAQSRWVDQRRAFEAALVLAGVTLPV